MRSNNWWPCLLLAISLMLAGCDHKTVYHHYEHTSLTGWEKNDALSFAVPHSTQRAVLQRDVELRISGAYPFRGLSLVVEQTTYPSQIRRRDTLNCQFMEPDGDYMVGGVSLYQYTFHLPDISLNEGDSLHYNIRHNMKREILPGISDVGIRLTSY